MKITRPRAGLEGSPRPRRLQPPRLLRGPFSSLLICCAILLAGFPAGARPAQERLNLNTATVEEFARLPGIGPAIAARIVEHRRRHGPFKRPQEIIIVHGMSAKRYRKIAHLIRI